MSTKSDAAEAIDDGGPAFPDMEISTDLNRDNPEHAGDTYSHSHASGMSLRDYFAANAPAAPDWWPLTEPDRVPLIPFPWTNDEQKIRVKSGDGHAEITVREAWQGYGDWLDADDIPAGWLDAFEQYKAAREGRVQAVERAETLAHAKTMISWRWFYADQMIKSRAAIQRATSK